MAAASLLKNQSALGAYCRRMCARLDRSKAVTVAAHKLARWIYAMLTKGCEYVGRAQDDYEERCRQRELRRLKRKAEAKGFRPESVADGENYLAHSVAEEGAE